MAVEYPNTLPKQSYTGHSNRPSRGFFLTEMDYSTKRRPSFTGVFRLPTSLNLNSQQLNDFNAWFFGITENDLLNGSRTFNARWEIMGITSLYEFAFLTQPIITPLSPDRFRVNFELELKTDIYEIIALNNLNGFCPEIIDCQRDLINWAISA